MTKECGLRDSLLPGFKDGMTGLVTFLPQCGSFVDYERWRSVRDYAAAYSAVAADHRLSQIQQCSAPAWLVVLAEHLLPAVDARGPSVGRANSQSVLLRGARRHCSVLLPTVFNGARIGARCVLMRS